MNSSSSAKEEVMNALHRPALSASVVFVALAGCSGSPSTRGTEEAEVKGKVEAIDVAKPAVTLDHEDIPELRMKGMKMEFRVADVKLLDGLRPGDRVRGKVKQTDSGYLITTLEKSDGGAPR
jgi:Cu/Ag efflux protein CusF